MKFNYAVVLKFFPLWAAALVLIAAKDAMQSQSTKVAAHLSRVQVTSRGFYDGSIPLGTVLGVEVQVPMANQLAMALTSDVSGNSYFNLSAALRYFPFSVHSRVQNVGSFVSVIRDDGWRPYISIAVDRGQLRLQTQDEIGASQISASYLGLGLGAGVAFSLSERWDLYVAGDYASLFGSAESPVVFRGTRVSTNVGVGFSF